MAFPRRLLIALVTVLVSGAVVGAFVLGRRSGGSGSGGTWTEPELQAGPTGAQSAGATVEGMPPPPPPGR